MVTICEEGSAVITVNLSGGSTDYNVTLDRPISADSEQ